VKILTMYEQDLQGMAKKVSSHRSGEWHGPCPVCGGSKRFRIQPNHGDYGYFKCRDCGVGGDDVNYLVEIRGKPIAEAMRELRGRATLTQPVRDAPKPSVRTDDNAWQNAARILCEEAHLCLLSVGGDRGMQYLKSRGLKDETIRGAGLGYISAARNETAGKWGMTGKDVYVPGPCVAIPRYRAERICGVKFRQLEGQPKYLQVSGSQPVLYGADNIKHEYLIMTEGEFDCLLLRQETGGLCDVATIGSASSDIPAEDILSLTSVNKALLAYDLDDAGMKGSVKIASDYPGFICNARSPGDITDYHMQGNSLRHWAVEELLLAGADVPFSDIDQMYNARLREHDDLANEVDNMPDTPERSRMLYEHAAMCVNMSRLITAIKAAGYTVTHSDAVYGFGM